MQLEQEDPRVLLKNCCTFPSFGPRSSHFLRSVFCRMLELSHQTIISGIGAGVSYMFIKKHTGI
jgi:hypothetical protein